MSTEAERKKIDRMFTKYKGASDERMMGEGIMKFLTGLKVKPDSRLVLILVWKMNAKTQCEFTRDEFRAGLEFLGADTLTKIKSRLIEVEKETLKDTAKFRDLYKFTFTYAKNPDQKGIDQEVAIAYWNIIFKDKFDLLPLWIEFVSQSTRKVIPRDTWILLFEFSQTINHDLTNYDDEGSWPLLLDEFVQWVRESRPQMPDSMDTTS